MTEYWRRSSHEGSARLNLRNSPNNEVSTSLVTFLFASSLKYMLFTLFLTQLESQILRKTTQNLGKKDNDMIFIIKLQFGPNIITQNSSVLRM